MRNVRAHIVSCFAFFIHEDHDFTIIKNHCKTVLFQGLFWSSWLFSRERAFQRECSRFTILVGTLVRIVHLRIAYLFIYAVVVYLFTLNVRNCTISASRLPAFFVEGLANLA